MGDLSAHFSRTEFACRHCGRLDEPPIPDLLAGLIAAYRTGGEWTPPRLRDLLAAPVGDGLSTFERGAC